MFTDVKRASCAVRAPVCVLLGGSGLRAAHPLRNSRIPALFKPWSSSEAQAFTQAQPEPAVVAV